MPFSIATLNLKINIVKTGETTLCLKYQGRVVE